MAKIEAEIVSGNANINGKQNIDSTRYVIEGKTFDEERALYGRHSLVVRACAFAGKADGESALKCASDIEVSSTRCALRYPFWHNDALAIKDCTMESTCRAALWYSTNVSIHSTKMHGIKALRECSGVAIADCDIISPEFGWFCHDVSIKNSTIEAEYFMLRTQGFVMADSVLNGKYSMQYVENAVIENCTLNTKDALWHARNSVVRHCTVNGEYLGWYSDGVTFEDCLLRGTQPLCQARHLRLVHCRMEEADRAFEKSDVEAEVLGRIESIKNPLSGVITCDEVGSIIMDEEVQNSKDTAAQASPAIPAKIIIRNKTV